MGHTSSQIAGTKFFSWEVTATFSLAQCTGLAEPLKRVLLEGEQHILSPWFRYPLFLCEVNLLKPPRHEGRTLRVKDGRRKLEINFAFTRGACLCG